MRCSTGAVPYVRSSSRASVSGVVRETRQHQGAGCLWRRSCYETAEPVNAPSPLISIVIPVYNEETILRSAVEEHLEKLAALGLEHEVVLAENGSTDGTPRIARELAREYSQVAVVHVPQANYGLGLRRGIEAARGEYVICDEADLLDTDFYLRALEFLRNNQADLVIGSKLIGGAKDERPLFRHAASLAYNALLRVLCDFRGTDTHGLKAMRRAALLPVVHECLVDKDVFASELVVRAYRQPLRVVEIPTRVKEKRPPSVRVWRRVPSVVANLAKLTWSIRMKG